MKNIFRHPSVAQYLRQQPVSLVDAGSSGGVHERWRSVSEFVRVIGFEPDERAFSRLADSGSEVFLKVGLLDKEGEVDFYLTRKQGASSIFMPNRQFLDRFPLYGKWDVIEKKSIKVDRLDNQLKEIGIDDVDFIKLDTQGSELHILRGSGDVLTDSVFGLEIEVEFLPLYEGQPLFSDIDEYARGLGFYLFDLNPAYWKREKGFNCGGPKGQLIFADALYFRNPESFMSILSKLGDDVVKLRSKVLRAVFICTLYGYYDYAIELFETCSDFFEETECDSIMRGLKDSVKWFSKIPNFRGRARIARLFRSVWNFVQPYYYMGSVSRKLGSFE